jgi:hypothetical protein
MALANLGLQSTPTNESNYRQCRPTGCIHSIVAVTRPPFLTTLKKSKRNQGPRLRGGQGEFRRYLAHRAVDLMVRRTWKSVEFPMDGLGSPSYRPYPISYSIHAVRAQVPQVLSTITQSHVSQQIGGWNSGLAQHQRPQTGVGFGKDLTSCPARLTNRFVGRPWDDSVRLGSTS